MDQGWARLIGTEWQKYRLIGGHMPDACCYGPCWVFICGGLFCGEKPENMIYFDIHEVISPNLLRGLRKSTFLPQVWEQFPDKETFLGHLCQKGGMDRRAWMDTETVVKTYAAEYFSESD